MKIFVGNVPFDCTSEEFINCFKHIQGFKNAELVLKDNKETKGFGFVMFDSEKNIEQLAKSEINVRGRILRFSKYNEIGKKGKSNYIHIFGLTDDITREDIYESLKNVNIGKYFIETDRNTGESKCTAIVEIKDKNVLSKILESKTIEIKDKKFQCDMYKRQVNKTSYDTSTSLDIYKMFTNQ